jgi:hypothetical protein
MALLNRSEVPLADAEPTITAVSEEGSAASPTPAGTAIETAISPPTAANLLAAEDASSAPDSTSTTTPLPASAPVLLPTVTPEPGAAVLKLGPISSSASWWSSGEQGRGHLNDSFLYAGYLQGDSYISAMRFDLRQVPRGAEIRQAQLRLTGLRADRLVRDPNALWWVELLAEDALDARQGADFLTVFSAPSSITLAPLRAADLNEGQVNSFDLDPLSIAWLEQQIFDGATSVTVRLKATTQEVDTRFGWDSGQGPETNGTGPVLEINAGPPPPTPPPLPTKPVIVATTTPIPVNVLTVVALNETATFVATTVGTNTPIPVDVVTPTPFPANLETVQAVTFAKGEPAVVADTPTPANAATATYVAAVATAFAQTTGTYTPVPTGYVTPIWIYPSPPAENILTEVARATEAASAALVATSTPVPFNGVFVEYAVATPTPENILTAAVMVAEATNNALLNGTPVPTPLNRVVILPTPLPVTPSATPTQRIEVVLPPSADQATATPLPPLDRVPAELSNHVLFRTTRDGTEGIFAVDMATNQLLRIHDSRIYDLAAQQVATSPDGKNVAMVESDINRLLQIKVYSAEYGTKKQITSFGPNPQRAEPESYDPAWSPRGDQIAFVTNNTGNDEIFLVDPEGQVLTQLTFNRTEWDKHPSWSPDASQIVFFSNRDSGSRRLWLMNADGSNQHELSSQLQPAPINLQYEDWDPVWVH